MPSNCKGSRDLQAANIPKRKVYKFQFDTARRRAEPGRVIPAPEAAISVQNGLVSPDVCFLSPGPAIRAKIPGDRDSQFLNVLSKIYRNTIHHPGQRSGNISHHDILNLFARLRGWAGP